MESPNMHFLVPRVLRVAMRGLVLLGFWGLCELGSLSPAPDSAYAIQALVEIQVRTQVMTTDKRMKLLDFCEPETIPDEWKPLLAGVDLGPVPEAGRETSINPQQILRRLQNLIAGQRMDPKQTRIQIPEKITVSRQQITLTREQIEEIYREFIFKKIPSKTTEDLVVRQISFSAIPALPSGNMSYEVTSSPSERFLGDVSVMIHFYVDGKEMRSLRVAGKVELYQDVVHTTRALKRNEILTDGDIQLLRANIAAHPDRYVLQKDQVVGKRLLCNIGYNQPVGPRDLENPPLIKRGDPVTIFFHQDGVRLSTRGEAKGNGGEGERIRIKNIDSKKDILCRVVDSQTVEVIY